MQPGDLERDIDAAVRRLPAPRAPRTLTPRVMAAIRARAARRAWYAGPVLEWPALAQLAVMLAALVLVAGFVAWGDEVLRTVSGLMAPATVRPGAWPAVTPPESTRWAVEVVVAARVVWRAVLGPVVFYASVFATCVGAVFALCAAVVTRLTFGRVVA